MSTFQVGELVRAQRSVQAFCTYDVEAVADSRGDTVTVGNAHLLFSRVAS